MPKKSQINEYSDKTLMLTMKDYGRRGSLFVTQKNGLDYTIVRLSFIYIKHQIQCDINNDVSC